MSYSVQIEIVKDLPVEQIKKWEDKVVYSLARETLDFTNTKRYFPRRSGDLQNSSMSCGVVNLGNMSYGLSYDEGTAYYTKYVWKMGEGTNWTNDNTLPQWYMSTFSKHKTELVQLAIKNAESELK